MKAIRTNIDEKPNFWGLHIAGWLAYIVIFAFDNILFTHETEASFFVIFPLFLSASMAFLLTLPLRTIYQKCWHYPPRKLLVIIGVASFIVALIWTPSKNITMWYFNKDMDFMEWIDKVANGDANPWAILTSLSYSFFMILVWSSLYFGLNYHYRLIQEKLLHIDAVRLSHQAQIKMLRYQINPHFLFNTLNAISTLVLQDNKGKANGMLVRLSTFLRFSLDNDPEKKVALYEEIKATMLYLEIEKTRFEERLTVDLKVEESAEKALVPSLLLQPLIENAIKYAIAKMPEGGLICINVVTDAEHIKLCVYDNGPGVDKSLQKGLDDSVDKSSELNTDYSNNKKEHRGVGIQNIKDRLNVLYPNQHHLKIDSSSGEGFKVSITLPLEFAQ